MLHKNGWTIWWMIHGSGRRPKGGGIRLSPVIEQLGPSVLDSTTMITYGAYISALDKFDLAYLRMIEEPLRQTIPGKPRFRSEHQTGWPVCTESSKGAGVWR